jgi:hypothetical protein
MCIEYLVVLQLTSDGTGSELDGMGVREEALGVSLELSDSEAGSGVGWLLAIVINERHAGLTTVG